KKIPLFRHYEDGLALLSSNNQTSIQHGAHFSRIPSPMYSSAKLQQLLKKKEKSHRGLQTRLSIVVSPDWKYSVEINGKNLEKKGKQMREQIGKKGEGKLIKNKKDDNEKKDRKKIQKRKKDKKKEKSEKKERKGRDRDKTLVCVRKVAT
ncbi:hypothetical protein RFI_25352, partial [Reticulomyxa filosa]